MWEATVDKRRPVVIVSRDDVRGVRSKATVAWVTTTIRSVPSEVALDHRDGLREASVVNCDELATINKSELVRRIGKLSEPRLADLEQALHFALQLRS